MPEYIFNAAISLDGFIACRDGSFDWLIKYDPNLYGFDSFLKSIDLIVQGSHTYEQLAAFEQWPYGDIPSIVLTSRELPTVPGIDIRFHHDGVESLVDSLKNFDGRIWILGGAQTLRSLINAGIRPNFELAIVPELIGSGIPLFTDHAWVGSLKLISSTPYPDGVVILRYESAV